MSRLKLTHGTFNGGMLGIVRKAIFPRFRICTCLACISTRRENIHVNVVAVEGPRFVYIVIVPNAMGDNKRSCTDVTGKSPLRDRK